MFSLQKAKDTNKRSLSYLTNQKQKIMFRIKQVEGCILSNLFLQVELPLRKDLIAKFLSVNVRANW